MAHPTGGAWTPQPDATTGVGVQQLVADLASLPTASGRLRVRAILHSTDGVTRPSVDAVRVFYLAAGDAATLAWDPLPVAMTPGVPVATTITAYDAAGVALTGLSGMLTLQSSHGGRVSPAQVALVDGRAAFDVAVEGIADDVRLHAALPDGVGGDSNPFDLVAPAGSTLVYVSGDGQFGAVGDWLGAPLVVRALDAAGNPLGEVQITFAVREGLAVLDPAVATTDATGVARTYVRLGAATGAVSMRAEGLGMFVDFVARADEAGATPPEGGCGCAVSRRADIPVGLAGLLVLAVTLLGRRRRPRE